MNEELKKHGLYAKRIGTDQFGGISFHNILDDKKVFSIPLLKLIRLDSIKAVVDCVLKGISRNKPKTAI